MEKHKIKLRDQSIDATTLERHRNYSLLLKQHRRATRLKRTRQFFIYTLLIAVVVVLLLSVIAYIMVRLERNREQKKEPKTSLTSVACPGAVLRYMPYVGKKIK